MHVSKVLYFINVVSLIHVQDPKEEIRLSELVAKKPERRSVPLDHYTE